jgi:hypothetical protein
MGSFDRTAVDERSAPRYELPRRARRIAIVLAAWGFLYACYRAYYALGGQGAMIGQPVSQSQFRAINAVAVVILLVAAVLPLLAVWSGSRPWVGRLFPVIGWVAAVGCCVHALVDATLRVLSLTGVYPSRYPSGFWLTIDRRAADLQDLLYNEPWFFVEGCLWAALALSLLGVGSRRRWWLSAVAGCLALTAIGLLSGLGVIGSFRLG